MRGTAINQSIYKKAEGRIGNAVAEGKDVKIKVDVKYDGESQRPSKIDLTYTIDGIKTFIQIDNNEGSTDLVKTLEGKIETSDLQDLTQEINDANADGGNMTVVAIKTEYDENGNAVKYTVTIRDENNEHPVNEDRTFRSKGSV